MSEILLQAIVEKREALEIVLLKQVNPGKDGEAFHELERQLNQFYLNL